MAEVIYKTYGKGNATAEAIATDMQKLWDFFSVEVGTSEISLWINQNTRIYLKEINSYSPIIKLFHNGESITISQGEGFSKASMYGVKTNRGAVIVYQTSTNAMSYQNNYILIGDAENPHTGVKETAVGCITYNNSKFKFSMLASDQISVIFDENTAPSTGQRNSIILPFSTSGSCAVMQSLYRLAQTQATPFFGECTFNGRKFHSAGIVLAEDD